MDLPDASRALAPCLWLLASESENGTIPADLENLSWRLRKDVVWLTDALIPLIQHGFLEDASNVLAECLQGATQIRSDQRQIRGRKIKTPHTPQVALNGFDEFWKPYPKKVSKKDAQKA